MIKKNKLKLIISSIVILLPIVAGLLLWDVLPDRMVTHWGADGAVDGFGSRFFAVVVPPVLILILHWVCVIVTSLDPRNKNQNEKALGLIFLICPFISLFANTMIYSTALGMEFGGEKIMIILVGLMFFAIGNYMPKCRQNHTLGIKVKWTLESEANWNATHRFCGRVWLFGGVILMMCAFLPTSVIPFALIVILTVLAALPLVYSYVYHRKQMKAGVEVINAPLSRQYKMILAVVLCVVAVMFIVIGVILLTGDVVIRYDEKSFTVEASYYGDLTVDYDAIETVENREGDTVGMRTNGFGSPRLQMGTFKNDEYGQYTRYAYTGCEACVVLKVDGKTLVLSGKDAESTRTIYDKLIKILQTEE